MAVAAVVTAGAWLGLGADSGSGETAGAEPPPPAIALAAVDHSGLLHAGDPQWRATRVGVGTYELQFPVAVKVALRSWTAIAEVTTRPIGDRTWIVTFGAGAEERIDSSFTFLASPAG
jgi:hypothetical protein